MKINFLLIALAQAEKGAKTQSQLGTQSRKPERRQPLAEKGQDQKKSRSGTVSKHECMPAEYHDSWYYYDAEYYVNEDTFCADFADKNLCTMEGTKGAAFDDYFHEDQTKEIHEMTNSYHDNYGYHALNCRQCGCVEPAAPTPVATSSGFPCMPADADWYDILGYQCVDYVPSQLCTSDGGYGAKWHAGKEFEDYEAEGFHGGHCPECGCDPNAVVEKCTQETVTTKTALAVNALKNLVDGFGNQVMVHSLRHKWNKILNFSFSKRNGERHGCALSADEPVPESVLPSCAISGYAHVAHVELEQAMPDFCKLFEAYVTWGIDGCEPKYAKRMNRIMSMCTIAERMIARTIAKNAINDG